MPLPLALQNRLLKRGIIKQNKNDLEPEEEIIAEDYDDHQSSTDILENIPQEKYIPLDTNKENKQANGCPNKWNIYHDCTTYCLSHWGEGVKTPNPQDEKKRLKMLAKYPLPENWQEIYDQGTGRYYYWNMETDQVSWLSPKHPRANVSLSAAQLRDCMKKEEQLKGREKVVEDAVDSDDKRHDDKYERRRERSDRDRERDRARGRRQRGENNLDPMDPASYSDTPRGTWSSGLERKGEAKTGADTTASGPLYQMRPYPSPGAVLRANAEMQKDKS
uniref:WW domain-containing protein n=1 Tax=Strigamia maritima TaxID=126957 RepID=T1IT40_STRMM